MSIGPVVTRGYGTFGSIANVVLRGYTKVAIIVTNLVQRDARFQVKLRRDGLFTETLKRDSKFVQSAKRDGKF